MFAALLLALILSSITVYNNDYNCQFPRAIRQEGRFFEVGSDDLMLVAAGGKTPFYRIKTTNIRILAGGPNTGAVGGDNEADAAVERPDQIFEVNECVICMGGAPEEIFIPCAHLCVCSDCYADIKGSKAALCPLCRRNITTAIKNKP